MSTHDAILIIAAVVCVVALAACILAHFLTV